MKIDLTGNEHSEDVLMEFLNLGDFSQHLINGNIHLEGDIDLYDVAHKVLSDDFFKGLNGDHTISLRTYDLSFMDLHDFTKEKLLAFVEKNPSAIKQKSLIWIDLKSSLEKFVDDSTLNKFISEKIQSSEE